MSKKDDKEYIKLYGHISKDLKDRVLYLFKAFNMTKKNIDSINTQILKLRDTKWAEINLVLYLVPKATPRARAAGGWTHFYVDGAKYNSVEFKKFVKEELSNFPMIVTPCEFICDIYSPTPKQMKPEEIILAELQHLQNVSKPDWDNVGKTYSDMIQNSLILDDSLITVATTRKLYSIKPRVEIKIRYRLSFDCKYNKRKVESWKSYKDNKDKIRERNCL